MYAGHHEAHATCVVLSPADRVLSLFVGLQSYVMDVNLSRHLAMLSRGLTATSAWFMINNSTSTFADTLQY